MYTSAKSFVEILSFCHHVREIIYKHLWVDRKILQTVTTI